jgi:hypothetical protein
VEEEEGKRNADRGKRGIQTGETLTGEKGLFEVDITPVVYTRTHKKRHHTPITLIISHRSFLLSSKRSKREGSFFFICASTFFFSIQILHHRRISPPSPIPRPPFIVLPPHPAPCTSPTQTNMPHSKKNPTLADCRRRRRIYQLWKWRQYMVEC